MQYQEGKKISISTGIIKEIKDGFDIFHTCSTSSGSEGSPILDIKNNKVIGIHEGSSIQKKYNYGIFIKKPLEEFYQKLLEQKKNREDLKSNNTSYSELYDYNCNNQSLNRSKDSYEAKFDICISSVNLKDLTLTTLLNQPQEFFNSSSQDNSFLQLKTNIKNNLEEIDNLYNLYNSSSEKTKKIDLIDKSNISSDFCEQKSYNYYIKKYKFPYKEDYKDNSLMISKNNENLIIEKILNENKNNEMKNEAKEKIEKEGKEIENNGRDERMIKEEQKEREKNPKD